MKVANYIVDLIEQNGIDTVFGHLGGFNANILDIIYSRDHLHYVMSYHEQASAFASNAYAMVSGSHGVAISSGAPSACNMIAGIANAYFDSIPCVFIAGSVHSLALRESKKIRQNAFEEIDMVHMVSDITKYAVRIKRLEDVRYEFEKAFHIANEGRKGPVLIDLAYDIARSDIVVEEQRAYPVPQNNYDENIDSAAIRQLFEQAKSQLFSSEEGLGGLKQKRRYSVF